jgi:hypothetical protein
VGGWAQRLLASPEPLAYLTGERGLSLDVIGAARIGWDGKALTFPMFSAGELVGFKRRAPRAGAQMLNWPGSGRPWPLYPEPSPGARWVLLVAGELDALRALSAGLPATSVTLGAGYNGDLWDEWTDALRGRRVVVCFDNNETEQARECVSRLGEAGISARRLDLRALGLDSPKGDLSDYLNGGGDSARLRAAFKPRVVVKNGRAA